jgi:hypothetical protein
MLTLGTRITVNVIERDLTLQLDDEIQTLDDDKLDDEIQALDDEGLDDDTNGPLLSHQLAVVLDLGRHSRPPQTWRIVRYVYR